jgi:hypothetical protein
MSKGLNQQIFIAEGIADNPFKFVKHGQIQDFLHLLSLGCSKNRQHCRVERK